MQLKKEADDIFISFIKNCKGKEVVVFHRREIKDNFLNKLPRAMAEVSTIIKELPFDKFSIDFLSPENKQDKNNVFSWYSVNSGRLVINMKYFHPGFKNIYKKEAQKAKEIESSLLNRAS
ncbi:MAG: hypothetical protein PHF44_00925 [Candidatus Pacebacteria bacterium]|nr:hypothetical protein [Candidatus Paceibacterota bacterium]